MGGSDVAAGVGSLISLTVSVAVGVSHATESAMSAAVSNPATTQTATALVGNPICELCSRLSGQVNVRCKFHA